MKKVVLLIFIMGLIIPAISLAYDNDTTHPAITEQTVEFYNLTDYNIIKISKADEELIIKGSIEEDNPGTRSLNHFYDPVRNMGINDYRTAVTWATEPDNGNDYTWEQNIKRYAEGDREGALFGFGHTLHLLQDMSVPDHTRNDPHIAPGLEGLYTGISEYEKWAKENKTRETMAGLGAYYHKNSGAKTAATVADYFTNLAKYSNSNYVSPDTIKNDYYQYRYPVVVEKINNYAYGDDTYLFDRHKLYIEEYSERYGLRKMLTDKEKENYSVVADYFERLSKRAILLGAGMTERFINEAENARTDYLEIEKIRAERAAADGLEKNKKITEGNFFSRVLNRLAQGVEKISGALAGTASGLKNLVLSVFHSGGAFAINYTKNFTRALGYTGAELATIGAQRASQGITTAKKVVVSAANKVIFYVTTKSSPVTAPSTPDPVIEPPVAVPALAVDTLVERDTPEEVLAVIPVSDPSTGGTASTPHHHSSGRHSAVISQEEAVGPVATSTDDDLPIATTTPDMATTTATSTEQTVEEPIATSTITYEPVTPPAVTEVNDFWVKTNATGIYFFGTSTPDYIISNDYNSTTEITDERGEWYFEIAEDCTGTTTINFFAEPDEAHLSSSTVDEETGLTHIVNYTKSLATEVTIFVFDFPDIFANEPEECAESLIPDGCLITVPEINMTWGSTDLISEYVIRLNNRDTTYTTDTAGHFYLDYNMANSVEIFALDEFGNQSDSYYYEVAFYEQPVTIEKIDWSHDEGVKITLRNNTYYDLDLSDWTLSLRDNSFDLNLTGMIPADGKYVLAKDTGVTQAGVDQIYTETFYNHGDYREIMNLSHVTDLISYYEFNPPSAY